MIIAFSIEVKVKLTSTDILISVKTCWWYNGGVAEGVFDKNCPDLKM